MRPPPAKPFAILCGSCFGLFILWGLVGAVLGTQITDKAVFDKIGRIVLPAAFGLFLIMGFSAVPVFVKLFFKLFFAEQKAAGRSDRPIVQKLQAKADTISAVLIYAIWTIFVLGSLMGGPLFLRDMLREMSGP